MKRFEVFIEEYVFSSEEMRKVCWVYPWLCSLVLRKGLVICFDSRNQGDCSEALQRTKDKLFQFIKINRHVEHWHQGTPYIDTKYDLTMGKGCVLYRRRHRNEINNIKTSVCIAYMLQRICKPSNLYDGKKGVSTIFT